MIRIICFCFSWLLPTLQDLLCANKDAAILKLAAEAAEVEAPPLLAKKLLLPLLLFMLLLLIRLLLLFTEDPLEAT